MTLAEGQLHDTAPALADFAMQGAVYDGLMHTLATGTFVHAYLISGAEGMGKRTLARLMGQYLLCTGESKPCGVCPACMQVLEDNHPDVIVVRPERIINVEMIRDVIRQVGEHTFEGGRRIVRIEQAEKMNPAAQNCLLKTLEEPVAGTIFLLLTDAPSLLLPTIVSRCRGIRLHPWPDEVVLAALRKRGVPEERAREALHVSGGSIGRALAVAGDDAYWQRRSEVMADFFALGGRSDILRISGKWKDRKEQSDELLDDLEDMLRTLLLFRLGQRQEADCALYPPPWRTLAQRADDATFARLLDAVQEARRMRANQVTWQAVVEQLLLHMMEEVSRWST